MRAAALAACLLALPLLGRADATPTAGAEAPSAVSQSATAVDRFAADEVVERLLKRQASLAAFSCSVDREEAQEGAAPRHVRGRLRANNAGMARYESGGQLMVSDGKVMWMVLPEARQAFRQDAQALRTSGQFFLDLTTSIRYYARNSRARLQAPGKGFDLDRVVTLDLSPKDPGSAGFDRVLVWVDVRRWQALQSRLTGNGMTVTVRFSDVKAYTEDQVAKDPKKKLSGRLFRYQPPKDYEVFDSFMP